MSASDSNSSPEQKSDSNVRLFCDVEKVYPRAVKGRFRRYKTAMMIFLLVVYYIAPWLRWDRGDDAPGQALLIDLLHSRSYFFGLEFWAQHIYYLTGVLVFAAILLFLLSTIAGRVWCGFICPQTIFVDVFVWIERLVEGDRAQRMSLDRAPWSLNKLRKKLTVYALWFLVSFSVAVTFVGYFQDIPTLVRLIVTLSLSQASLWFVLIFTALTYLFCAYLRENFCIYMCPWPRFQCAMQDEESLMVTYQALRGEPRSAWRKSVDWEERAAQGYGDCVNCGQCKQVCPTGVDIREGSHIACIGCGLCIDACDSMMRRIKRPEGLISFDTQNNQIARAAGQPPRLRLIRSRTIIYVMLLLAVGGFMSAHYLMRPMVTISVLRDRAPIFTTLVNGDIHNGYTLHISNMTQQRRVYALTVSGITGALLSLAGSNQVDQGSLSLTAAPDSVESWRITVRAPRTSLQSAASPLRFVLRSDLDRETEIYHSVFRGPEKHEAIK
ncbi:4Fe-4S ferredoxin-type domain-containing protein [Azospirillaceae bacterium]